MTTPPDQRDERIAALEAENEKLRGALKKALGIDSPFICGASEERGADGLPTTLHVCPAYGLDGFAVYRKARDYGAPSY